MPIVFIHGVAVRNSERKLNAWWPDLLEKLRRYAAPVISGRPDRVTILPAYWGALGVQFAWGGASRPLSVMLGKGGIRPAPDWLEQAVGLAEMPGLIRGLPSAPAASESEGTLVAKGPGSTWSGTVSGRLKDLDPEELAALTMAAVRNAPGVHVTHPTEFFSDLSDDELRSVRRRPHGARRDRAGSGRGGPGALYPWRTQPQPQAWTRSSRSGRGSSRPSTIGSPWLKAAWSAKGSRPGSPAPGKP